MHFGEAFQIVYDSTPKDPSGIGAIAMTAANCKNEEEIEWLRSVGKKIDLSKYGARTVTFFNIDNTQYTFSTWNTIEDAHKVREYYVVRNSEGERRSFAQRVCWYFL